MKAEWHQIGVAIVFLASTLTSTPVVAEQIPESARASLEECLIDTIEERDILNLAVQCFNATRRSCTGEAVACDAAMASLLEARGDQVVEGMPDELEGGPEFARDNYRELKEEIAVATQSACNDVSGDTVSSCAYRAQAVRLARLWSLGAQLDPRFLVQ